MKILIMTNIMNYEALEDMWIGASFKKDGHEVALVEMDYPEKLDEVYDVFIRRNNWYMQESKMIDYYNEVDKITERITKKNLHRINFNGKFDAANKEYLVKLYQKGYPVIPSFLNPNNISILENVEEFLLKPLQGYDGFGQFKISKEQLKEKYKKNYLIQPVLKFNSELQFYFLNNEFQYALEYIGSKVPVKPSPKIYNASDEEIKLAFKFAILNEEFTGVQRIDFIKLENGKILLLEIEDAAPYLELDCLDIELRNKFINNYKEMIYDYINNRLQ